MANEAGAGVVGMPNLSGCCTGVGLVFRAIRPLIATFRIRLPEARTTQKSIKRIIVSPENGIIILFS
jgi:hypothetical protein